MQKQFKFALFGLFLTMFITACYPASLPAPTAEKAEKAAQNDESPLCEIIYTITNEFEGGFNAEIELTNYGDQDILDWTLSWSFIGDEQITNLTPVEWEQNGPDVVAHTDSPTYAILANDLFDIQFEAHMTGEHVPPTTFVLSAETPPLQGVNCNTDGAIPTSVPPTETPIPPTDTPVPPTETPPPIVAWIYVPEGAFVMGGDDGLTDEEPAHTVYLDEFWMMETEVTNAQYAQCVAEGACDEPANSEWEDADLANHPVAFVSWHQASAYAEWVGGRLPTEAEWEKAACGTDGRIYPWGDEEPNENLLNFDGNIGDTIPVGSYPDGASPYGALDMAGNLWEWTADWFGSDYYESSPAQNPTGPPDGIERVLRGGAFSSNEDSVRCGARGGNVPDNQNDNFGFRLVWPPFETDDG